MNIRPLAIWLAVVILALAFWPAIAAIFNRLSLPLPLPIPGGVRGALTWIDIMVFIGLALLALRAVAMRRPVIRQVLRPRSPREDAP